jgi:hypothetical protein
MYINTKLNIIPFKKTKLFEDIGQMHFYINDVKMTFFHYPYPLTHETKIKNIISMPELRTLAAMKAFALGRWAKWKDYVDLYFIIKDHFSINEIAEDAKKCFGDMFSERLFRQQLAFHADIDYSEPVEYLVSVISDNEIRQFLIDKALEIKL